MIFIGRHHCWRTVARSSLLGARFTCRLTVLRAVSPRPLPFPFPFLPPLPLPLPLPLSFIVFPKVLACLAGLACRPLVLSTTSTGRGEAERLAVGSPGRWSHAMEGKGLGGARRSASYLTISGFSSKEVRLAGGVGSRGRSGLDQRAKPSLIADFFCLAVLRLAARPAGTVGSPSWLRLVALRLGVRGDVRTL